MMRLISFLIALVWVMTLLSSCKVEKRLHRPGYHVEWVKKKPTTQVAQATPNEFTESPHSSETENEPPELAVASNHSTQEVWAGLIEKKITTIAKQLAESRFTSNGLEPDKSRSSSKKDIVRQCETLVLLDGRRILIFVAEIGEEEIHYKRCDDARGKVHTILRKDVLRIEYPDGTHRGFQSEEKEGNTSGHNESSDQPKGKEFETIGAGAFALSLFLWVSLFFATSPFFLIVFVILGILSLYFSIVSLRRFQSNPNRFKGIAFALAGLVISVIALIVMLLLFAAVLFVV